MIRKIPISYKSTPAEKIEFVDRFIANKSKAGKASAAKLTPEQRKERARKAAQARINKKKGN